MSRIRFKKTCGWAQNTKDDRIITIDSRGGEMVYAQDLKSCEDKTSCGFESHPRHQRDVAQLVECALWEREVESPSLSIPTHV